MSIAFSMRTCFTLNRVYSTLGNNQYETHGFVGGYCTSKGEFGQLSPALKFIDDIFLNKGIYEKISKTLYPKRGGDSDFIYGTFMQRNFNIVYTAARPKYFNDEKMDLNIHGYKMRECIGKGIQLLQRRGVREIYVDPFFDGEIAAETAVLAAFKLGEFKSNREGETPPKLHCFTSHLDSDPDGELAKESLLSAWNRGLILAESQNLARRWTDLPSNILCPTTFATEIGQELALISSDPDHLRLVVHEEDWIRANNMGGILAVSAGSARKPLFLEIFYNGNPGEPNECLALVGKGVTFDSGGISLKPSQGMWDMRGDMGGAAVVAATVLGLARLHSPINVRAYLPLCENMPDGAATRPGDVIKLANGKTVEVNNTDAEGRLILADGLHYALSEATTARLVMDVATLTGAISVALGDQYTGLFANSAARRCRLDEIFRLSPNTAAAAADEKPALRILDALKRCGRERHDNFWSMPLLYQRELGEGSHLGDLSNITMGAISKLGGAGSAAGFLSHFTNPRIPWIHLDIAGVMKNAVEQPFLRRGMTGRPTRPLIDFLDKIARM